MGAGISLSKTQIIEIIKRTLKKEYDDMEARKPLTVDGYLVYYDFSDEVEYNKKIALLNKILCEIK